MAAGAPLEFLPPRLDGRVLTISRWLLPIWLHRLSGIGSVNLRHPSRLVEAMARFQAGQTRLLLAFRHPSLDDAACMAHLLWVLLPREGRSRGLRWRPRPHAQFLYDRGIPLWAGEAVGWLLSHLGGSSIQRGKLDLPALRTARELLLQSPHPFAAAPEGSTNGHNEVVSSLEPGVAQLAFWTADDLTRAGRPERMEILPIGIQYSYETPVWPAIETLLGQLERDAGLAPPTEPGSRPASDPDLDPEHLYLRLVRLGERMLTLMENFYREAYHICLPGADAPVAPNDAPNDADVNAALNQRLRHLQEAALGVVERSFAIEPRGGLTDRCRRLEQAGWDRLYPATNGAGTPEACALQRGLADRLAEETERRMWHMRVVESFVAMSGTYVKERPSQERFADTLLLLWDTHCRIRGGNPGERPRLGRRRVLLSMGEPLDVHGRMGSYRTDRRRAVADLTQELQQRLEGLIVPSGTRSCSLSQPLSANRVQPGDVSRAT